MTTSTSDRRIDIPGFFESQPDFALGGACDRSPLHVINFFGRAEEIFRGAVAIQAPGHALGLVLVNDLHGTDIAVAALAADASIYVHGVIEVGVVGGLVDADPFDGLSGGPTFANGGEFRAVVFNFAFAVAPDAGGGGGDVGVGGYFDIAVAVTAIHAELFHMDDVGEGDGLIRLVTNAGIFRSKVVPHAHNQKRADTAEDDDYFGSNPVAIFRKKVGHAAGRTLGERWRWKGIGLVKKEARCQLPLYFFCKNLLD